MTVKEILLLAATKIDTVGLCKGVAYHLDGRMCTLGAIQNAGGTEFRNTYRAEKAFRKYLYPGDSISAWNDAPARTKEEVVTALRVVAASL